MKATKHNTPSTTAWPLSLFLWFGFRWRITAHEWETDIRLSGQGEGSEYNVDVHALYAYRHVHRHSRRTERVVHVDCGRRKARNHWERVAVRNRRSVYHDVTDRRL